MMILCGFVDPDRSPLQLTKLADAVSCTEVPLLWNSSPEAGLAVMVPAPAGETAVVRRYCRMKLA
jgi:hypothetical protein